MKKMTVQMTLFVRLKSNQLSETATKSILTMRVMKSKTTIAELSYRWSSRETLKGRGKSNSWDKI